MLSASFDELLSHPTSLKPLLLSRERAVLLLLQTFENVSRSLLGSLASQQGGTNKAWLSQDTEEILDNIKLLQSRFEQKHCIRK